MKMYIVILTVFLVIGIGAAQNSENIELVGAIHYGLGNARDVVISGDLAYVIGSNSFGSSDFRVHLPNLGY